MKISGMLVITIVFAAVLAGKASPQSDSAIMARHWVKSKAWARDLKVNVYHDVNALEFYNQYHKATAMWDKVFAYLADTKMLDTIKPGTYPVDGKNIYAIITEGPEKTEETAKWESHRKYIDLHYVIRGKEKMGVAAVSAATIIVPYNEEKDGANYTADGKYYIGTPAEFYLFFPSEAHRPNLHIDGYDTVKKLVIKIKYVQ